jgi:hypothetical protein
MSLWVCCLPLSLFGAPWDEECRTIQGTDFCVRGLPAAQFGDPARGIGDYEMM